MELTGGYTEYENEVDYHLTYSEEEKQEIEITKANAKAIFSPEFIPYYLKDVQELGLTPIEGLVYGFIRFYMKNNSGRFYFSNKQLAEMLGTTDGNMKHIMAKLKKLGVIETGVKVRAGGGTIRFIKSFNLLTFQSESQLTSRVSTHSLSYKENKKKKIKPQTLKKRFEDDDIKYLIAKRFYERKLENESLVTKKLYDSKGEDLFQEWADEVRKLIDIDKHTVEQIKKVFGYVLDDSFWDKQIHTVNKFRQKKDGVTYFIYFLNKIGKQ